MKAFKCGLCLHIFLETQMHEDPSKWCPVCESSRYWEVDLPATKPLADMNEAETKVALREVEKFFAKMERQGLMQEKRK